MKRWISLLVVITLLLGLCACGVEKATVSPDDATTSAPFPEASISPDMSAEGGTVEGCVVIDETETKYGLIQIPQIDEAMQGSEDVRIANEMFRSVRDQELEWVEVWTKEWGDETYHNAAEPLCSTRYTQNGNLLSIIVKYIRVYPSLPSMEYYESVNIDISTGKALNHREVIKAAGFTEDEVKAALRYYADRSMFDEWEHDVYNNCGVEGTLPDGLGDASLGWQETLDELAAGYDTPATPQGEPWDELPHYPAVYADGAGLEVCVKVPIAAGWGYYDTMVCIGHNDAETRLLNPNNPFGQAFGQEAMTTDAACEAVAHCVGLDDTYTDSDGVQYGISAESMAFLESDGQFDSAYVVRVYTDEGDHIATVGWYAVGAFTGMLWEMDIASDEWIPIMNGTGLLPEEIYTGADMNGVLAVIWNEPGDYGLWAVNPCAEVDLTAYDSDTNQDISNSETFLLFAIEDGTFVSFDAGTMEGDIFASQSQLSSLTLNIGDSVLVHAVRPNRMPTQAITVSTADDVGIHIIQYYDPAYRVDIEYITSISAMG